jgi:SAM-dependent methyltransferase
MNIDDSQTTALRLQIIRTKPFLRKLYEEWYRDIATHFPSDTRVLELGSGAGFLKEFIPQLITSELFSAPGVERIIDAQAIAMGDASLDGIVMMDVLHHISDCSLFFHEAARVIRVGGKVVMIEPWNTTWSRWVYQRLHHEPFEPDARGNGGFRRQVLSLVRMEPFPGLFFSAIGSHSNQGIRSGVLSAFIQSCRLPISSPEVCQ